eukprot:TRINITY_DN21286_c0_g2_i1.p1 TRINITY_DN21286_c0_g2~~TRINITY_DN21286_c0_g2_i1.p1  ORF type:complete len:220 (+),score=60.94 TRINITY_DN21286_c0_g2_i1:194-853(+)
MASGGSVIAVKYDGGVLMAADTLLSFGSLAKWPNIPRIKIIGKHTAVCASGDYADFQEVCKDLEEGEAADQLIADGIEKTPEELFSVLHRTIYGKRCEFKPAMCKFIVIGSTGKNEDFIGAVDDIGTKWTANCVASGYGAHIAIPELRKALENHNNSLTRDQALAVVTDCLRTLFYRECRAINKFQIADASNGKVVISEPTILETQWEFDGFAVKPFTA